MEIYIFLYCFIYMYKIHFNLYLFICIFLVLEFPGGSDGKESACDVEESAWVLSLGRADPLEKKMAMYSSLLA